MKRTSCTLVITNQQKQMGLGNWQGSQEIPAMTEKAAVMPTCQAEPNSHASNTHISEYCVLLSHFPHNSNKMYLDWRQQILQKTVGCQYYPMYMMTKSCKCCNYIFQA